MTGTDPACKWSALVLSRAVTASFRETALWRDLVEVPDALRQTLAAADGFDAAADALRGATRVIATGNGAAYYVAQALWLASLDGVGGPTVEALPGGLVAGGRFPWRDGDRLLAVSSSGEFRDVIDAVEQGAPRPVACVTAKPDSSVGRLADGRAVQTVLHQRALTHTQAFCGGVATALAVWARVTGDEDLQAVLDGAADAVEQAIAATERFMDGLGPLPLPSAAVVFGSGPAWAAALEGALFLKEVAMVPTEGCETREGGTTAMFALGEGQLVLSLATRDDPLLEEAERTCASRGATVVRLPGGDVADRRLAPITTLPAITAVAASLALTAGRDPDHPVWEAAYLKTARRP
jgi:fructoselysine-6-P-deglycase FrlB-like protein